MAVNSPHSKLYGQLLPTSECNGITIHATCMYIKYAI